MQNDEARQLAREACAVHAEALAHGQRSAGLRRRGGREALEKAVALIAGGLSVFREIDLPPDHVHARHVKLAQLLKHRAVAVRHAAVGQVVDVQMPGKANAVSAAPVVNRLHVVASEQLALQRAVILAGARVRAGYVLVQIKKRGKVIAQVIAEAREEFFREAVRPREAPGARLVGENEGNAAEKVAHKLRVALVRFLHKHPADAVLQGIRRPALAHLHAVHRERARIGKALARLHAPQSAVFLRKCRRIVRARRIRMPGGKPLLARHQRLSQHARIPCRRAPARAAGRPAALVVQPHVHAEGQRVFGGLAHEAHEFVCQVVRIKERANPIRPEILRLRQHVYRADAGAPHAVQPPAQLT